MISPPLAPRVSLCQEWGVSANIEAPPFLCPPRELEHIFRTCVEEWSAATQFTSSVTQMILHPAYQRIVGLGRQAIPLLLAELEVRPDHWFPALRSITGEGPADPDDDFDQAVQAWLRWGRERDYIR